MKHTMSLRMEARPFRIIGMLLLVLGSIPGLMLCCILGVLAIRTLGYDHTPSHKDLRIGMSTTEVCAIMGEPDGIAILSTREDWWYSKHHTTQLTFKADRLVSNHSKDHLRERLDDSEDMFLWVVTIDVLATVLPLTSAYLLLRTPRQKTTVKPDVSSTP